MLWYSIVVITMCFYTTSGRTKSAGIEQFWADDYKVFEQIYGKTSDRDIYGASLPATINQGIFKTEASEKKERFQLASAKYPYYSFGDFNELFKNAKVKRKPVPSSYSFIKYDGFKPISEIDDPVAYKYLQYLEAMDKEHGDEQKSGGFTSYLNGGKTNPKDTEAYKSIQDILDAHEQNKEKEKEEHSNNEKNTGTKSQRIRNSSNFNRCRSGGCKQRTNYVRNRARPHGGGGGGGGRVKHRYIKY